MEEKKEIKVSLGTVICIFIILVLIIALAVMYLYYNDKLSFNNEKAVTNINDNSNEIIETELKKTNKIYEDKEIVYSSYEKYSSEYSYSIPAININSTEVNKINKEIEEYYMPLINEELQKENKEGGLIIKYNSYINDNILSLVISMLTPYDATFYKVYNIDVYKGTSISNSELINLKNITETPFIDNLKTSYKEKFISEYGKKNELENRLRNSSSYKWTEEEIQVQVNLYEELFEKTISEENCSIKNPIFLNENGEISAVACIYSMAGREAYYHIVDINLEEENISIKPIQTINKLFKNANEAEEYISKNNQDKIKFYEQEILIGDAIISGLVSEYKVSSMLKEEYSIENVSNFYTENCWCEGTEGDGIGETIEINTFDSCEKIEWNSSNRSMKSIDDTIDYLLTDYNTEGGRTGTEITKDNISNYYSEINQIAIINGYAKDDTLWKNNNRVKKLKLTIDNTNQFILELEDTKDLQLFDINYKNENITKKINMKFEILEIYKGAKYNDTCITSIYPSGGSNIQWGGR